LLTVTTGFILMIIWQAPFLCGWWMIFAHNHNRIHSPGPYDYMTSFLPLWMMDDSCSRSQQDSFPWTLLWLYDELPSFVDDGWWFLLTTTNGFPLVMCITSFLLWMMDEWFFAHNHTRFPWWLWLSQASFVDDGWILLANKPQLESPVNQQPPAHYVGWMDGWMDGVYTEKFFSVIFLYQYSYPWAREN
jgi:hypothetical protein